MKIKPIVVPSLDVDNHSGQHLDRISGRSANRLPERSPYRAPLLFRRLRRSEFPIATVALARFLVGKIVVRELQSGRISGRIVETEAYPPRDPAAHHFRGPTPRNRTMYLRRGHAYVYFIYGNHFMLNVSAEVPDVGGGILIRALEPLEGIEQMQRLRQTMELRDLTRGPGRLAEALEIDRRLDGIDLCAPGVLWLELKGQSRGRVRFRHQSSRNWAWHQRPHRNHPRSRTPAALLRARQSLRERSRGAQFRQASSQARAVNKPKRASRAQLPG